MKIIHNLDSGKITFSDGLLEAVDSLLAHVAAEAYLLLHRAAKSSHDEMRTVFSDWNRGELADTLMKTTADALGLRDDDGEPLLEKVLDTSRGREPCAEAAAAAIEHGVPAPSFAQAAVSSFFAAMRNERIDASALLDGPKPAPTGDRSTMIDEIRKAVLAATVLAYAQVFMLVDRVGDDAGPADLAVPAADWAERRGSFVLALVAEALRRCPTLDCVILDAGVKALLDRNLPALRRVAARSLESGLPVPAMTACLHFYDEYRSTRLPANLVSALKDSLGGSGYERVDRPRGEVFHSEWR